MNALYLNGHDNTTNVSDMPTPVEKDILVRRSMIFLSYVELDWFLLALSLLCT